MLVVVAIVGETDARKEKWWPGCVVRSAPTNAFPQAAADAELYAS